MEKFSFCEVTTEYCLLYLFDPQQLKEIWDVSTQARKQLTGMFALTH